MWQILVYNLYDTIGYLFFTFVFTSLQLVPHVQREIEKCKFFLYLLQLKLCYIDVPFNG